MIFYSKSFTPRKIYLILSCITLVKISAIYNTHMMKINNNLTVTNSVILIVVKPMAFIGTYVIDKKKA